MDLRPTADLARGAGVRMAQLPQAWARTNGRRQMSWASGNTPARATRRNNNWGRKQPQMG
eukprot:3466708-Lingulodinium_polyedra.AAC.1